MALDVIEEDDGTIKLYGIRDHRDDPEGMLFDFANMTEEEIEPYMQKWTRVYDLQESKKEDRLKSTQLDFVIEPVESRIAE